jgi:hypothetical protein
MKNLARLTSATLAVLLSTAGASLHAQYGPPQGPPPGAYQGQGGWDGPPNEFNEVQRRGFHDGIEGARKDYENHRPANINNRDEFRHPPVPGPLVHDYRVGFRRGYQAAVRHMMGGGPH